VTEINCSKVCVFTTIDVGVRAQVSRASSRHATFTLPAWPQFRRHAWYVSQAVDGRKEDRKTRRPEGRKEYMKEEERKEEQQRKEGREERTKKGWKERRKGGREEE